MKTTTALKHGRITTMSASNEGEYMGCDERPDILHNNEEQRMSVMKKLTAARQMLQDAKIKKTGKNQHQGFGYYELSDFIPKILKINEEVGLLSAVSLDSDLCKLVVYDVDGDTSVEFTAPMSTAQLPGKSQPVQNLGATITYMRRYLYMLAYDITEPDIIDAADQSKFEKNNKGWKNATKAFYDSIQAVGLPNQKVIELVSEFGYEKADQIPMESREKFIARLNHEKANAVD